MNKKIMFTVGALIIMTATAGISQPHAPPIINFQGKIADTNGVPLGNLPGTDIDGQIDIAFRIYDSLTGGTEVWGQTSSDVYVERGLFSVLLTNLNNSVFPTNSAVCRWLEVEVRDWGATNTLMPRKEIVSVPYAINADMVDGFHADDLTYTGQAPISITNRTISLNYDTNDFVLIGTVFSVRDQGIDHGLLNGLADDDHIQYSGAGWDTTTTLRTSQDHIARTDNPHSVTLNQLGHSDNNPEEEAPGDTTRGEPTKNEIRTWGQLDDANPAEEAPTATERGEPTRAEIELWGDKYDDVGITVETDPQVDDAMTLSSVPRWNGAKLITGNIYNDPAGNVGIGTPSPAAKLDVNGDAVIRGVLDITTGANWIRGGTMGRLQRPFLALSAQAPAYGYDWVTTLVPQNVGLYVANHENDRPNIHVRQEGDLWVHRDLIEGSDGRMKLGQRGLDYGLEQIMALKPKRYNQAEWAHEKENGKIIIHSEKTRNEIGLVAQDVQKIIPEAVDVPEDETRLPWGIAYSKLVPVLVKAIQDQQQQIEKLEEKITRLEKKNTK